jgi:hypothetical protein
VTVLGVFVIPENGVGVAGEADNSREMFWNPVSGAGENLGDPDASSSSESESWNGFSSS